METLIDTHVLLWYLLDPGKLSPSSRNRLQDAQQTVLVSIASIWEASIKGKIGKLHLPADLIQGVRQVHFRFLEIVPEDAWMAGQLPLHHRDPFDRILIAQALRRNLPLMTADKQFSSYSVNIVPV